MNKIEKKERQLEQALSEREQLVDQLRLQNPTRFERELIRLSRSVIWTEILREWEYKDSYSGHSYCLCGNSLQTIFIFRNVETGVHIEVGSTCIKKFLNSPANIDIVKAHKSFIAIGKDIDRPLKWEAIVYAFEHGWIADWDRDFYLSTYRRRGLSSRQSTQRKRINTKIIKHHEMRTSICTKIIQRARAI